MILRTIFGNGSPRTRDRIGGRRYIDAASIGRRQLDSHAEKCTMAAGTSTTATSDRSWFIIQRWQAYEAESRANLLRICAIGLFYLVHLWSYFSSLGKLPNFGFLQLADAGAVSRQFHIAVTWLAVAWAMFALAILIALQQQF